MKATNSQRLSHCCVTVHVSKRVLTVWVSAKITQSYSTCGLHCVPPRLPLPAPTILRVLSGFFLLFFFKERWKTRFTERLCAGIKWRKASWRKAAPNFRSPDIFSGNTEAKNTETKSNFSLLSQSRMVWARAELSLGCSTPHCTRRVESRPDLLRWFFCAQLLPPWSPHYVLWCVGHHITWSLYSINNNTMVCQTALSQLELVTTWGSN